MFIFAVEKIKEQWKKYLIICMLALCALGVLLAVLCINGNKMPEIATCDEIGEYSLSADSLKRETEFLEQFGLTPDAESLVSDEVVIPSDFNQTYAEYNRLQQEIGLDLRNYKGVSAKRDIFKLENYESDGKEYYATLLIYKDKVIGGHIGTKIYSDEYRSLAN